MYYIRLQRDGWLLRGPGQSGRRSDVAIFEKPINRRWTLRKLAHASIPTMPGRGCYYDEHQLLDQKAGAVTPCSHWEWAEVDGKRLLWAAAGKLWAGRLGAQGLFDQCELIDFNSWQFEARQAPY